MDRRALVPADSLPRILQACDLLLDDPVWRTDRPSEIVAELKRVRNELAADLNEHARRHAEALAHERGD